MRNISVLELENSLGAWHFPSRVFSSWDPAIKFLQQDPTSVPAAFILNTEIAISDQRPRVDL